MYSLCRRGSMPVAIVRPPMYSPLQARLPPLYPSRPPAIHIHRRHVSYASSKAFMHRALANLKKFGLGMKSLFMDGKVIEGGREGGKDGGEGGKEDRNGLRLQGRPRMLTKRAHSFNFPIHISSLFFFLEPTSSPSLLSISSTSSLSSPPSSPPSLHPFPARYERLHIPQS